MSYRYPVMEKPAQESWRSGFEEQDVELGDDAASLVRAVPLATSARGPGFFLFCLDSLRQSHRRRRA